MIVTVAEYKTFIQVSGSRLDAYYQMLLDDVTSLIRAETKQYLTRQTGVVEYYCPRFDRTIVLKQRPVIRINSIYYDPDSSFDSTGTLQVAATDYQLKIDQADGTSRSGIVYLLNRQGSGILAYRPNRLTPDVVEARGTIKVDYDCGFDPIPNDLKLIVKTAARALQNASPYGGLQVTSESRPHYNYSLGEMLNKELTIKRMLSRYIALGLDIV